MQEILLHQLCVLISQIPHTRKETMHENPQKKNVSWIRVMNEELKAKLNSRNSFLIILIALVSFNRSPYMLITLTHVFLSR